MAAMGSAQALGQFKAVFVGSTEAVIGLGMGSGLQHWSQGSQQNPVSTDPVDLMQKGVCCSLMRPHDRHLEFSEPCDCSKKQGTDSNASNV